ncbi:MAG: MFS transporter [Gammaproteobacteria bacterium]
MTRNTAPDNPQSPENPPRPAASRFARWRAATLSPFGYRTFALFWTASLFSSFGGMFQTVGASWLMSTIAPSPDWVALVVAANSLPFFALSLIAGALGDTYDKRIVMLGSQLLAAAGAVALAVLALHGAITPTLLLVFTFVVGCGAAILSPTWQASVGDLVPRDKIPAAVSANSLGFNSARSVGPAIGGIIVASAGAAVAFVVNAISYLGLILVIYFWRPPRPHNPLPPEPLGAAILAGLRYVRLSPPLVAIYIRATTFTVSFAAVQALMPVVARDLHGGDARMYGLLLGGFGVGAVLGALSNTTLRTRFSNDRLVQIMSFAAAGAALTIGLSPWLLLTAAAYMLAGGTWILALLTVNVSTQFSSPRWVTARTLAIYQTLAFGGLAAGSWMWGEIAHAADLRVAMCLAGAALLCSGLIAPWARIPTPETGSFDPHGGAPVAEPELELQPSSGPIVLSIEYRIAPDDAPEFLSLINELGRIRRRDGARDWSICQDIDDPVLWVERFESPTWLDHQRRQSRPTKTDQAVRERIAALAEGGRGTVRRFIERPPGSRLPGMPDDED